MNKYIEYQINDMKLFKIEQELLKSKEFEDYSKYKSIVQSASNKVIKLENDAKNLISAYEKLTSDLKELLVDIEEVEKAVVGVDDVKEIEYYQKNIEVLEGKINDIDRERQKISANISETQKLFNDYMDAGKKASLKLRESKEKLDGLRNSKMNEVKEIKEELVKISKELNPEVMTKYKQLREMKKMPVFVQLSGNSCKGCGMELAVDTLNKLKNPGDHTECPNCHRILFVEE